MSNHGNKIHSSFGEEAQFSFPWEMVQGSSPCFKGKQGKEKEKTTTTATTVDMKEHLPLPPPPCLKTTPRHNSMITKHGSLRSKVDDDDPFFAAYMKCIKNNIGETTEEMKMDANNNKKKKKKKKKKKMMMMMMMMMMIGGVNGYGRRIGARMSGFGFSCKSSHGTVMEDAMIRLPRSPRSP